jgi:hypothetical protein
MIEEATREHINQVVGLVGNEVLGTVQIADIEDLNSGQGFTWALVRDGKPLAIGGVRELWPGTGEAWMLATKMIRETPVEITKAFRGALRRADDNGFIRVQCVVGIHFIESQQWVERAGFDVECMLESYINRENYFMYARVQNGR